MILKELENPGRGRRQNEASNGCTAEWTIMSTTFAHATPDRAWGVGSRRTVRERRGYIARYEKGAERLVQFAFD